MKKKKEREMRETIQRLEKPYEVLSRGFFHRLHKVVLKIASFS